MKMTRIRLALMLGVVMLATGCARPALSELAFSVVEQGSAGEVFGEFQARLLSHPQQLAETYRELHSGRSPMPSPPQVDFSRQRLLLILSPTRPSGGHGVELLSLRRQGEQLQARIRFTYPPADALTTAVITRPYLLLSYEPPPGVTRVVVSDEQGQVLAELPQR